MPNELRSQATKAGIATALVKFNAFLAYQALMGSAFVWMATITIETLPETRVTKDLLLLFAMYLITVPHSVVLIVSQFHRADTAAQYLSAVKNHLILTFPKPPPSGTCQRR